MRTTDVEATYRAIEQAATRVSGVVRAAPDPAARVPGLDWNVGEAAAHVVGALRAMTSLLTGERDAASFATGDPGGASPAPARAAALNARLLEREVTERDLDRLSAEIVDAATAFVAAATARPGSDLVETWLSVPLPASDLGAILLGELLVHGFDLASATRHRWEIPPGEALIVAASAVRLMPQYLDQEAARGVRVAYEVRLRGGPRWLVRIAGGALTVEPAGGAADCWISADPAAFLLVGYGRMSQWRAVATGKLFAGGRRPWLALRFTRYLTSI